MLVFCFSLDTISNAVNMCSLVDSIHGGSGQEGMTPLDQQHQLFASAGAIKFPTRQTEAWKEKVFLTSKLVCIALSFFMIY